MHDLSERYFNHLVGLVGEYDHRYLLLALYRTDYVWEYPLDQNREQDGIELRFHYAEKFGIDYRYLEHELGTKPCSVLEMIIALALRIENEYMANDIYDDRTGHWFWNMINSLGLLTYSDNNFDLDKVEEIVFKFLHHQYLPNGAGGLFYMPQPDMDMRKAQIWDQMNHWLIWQNQI